MQGFETRRIEALRLLEQTGIRRSNYCPPLLRLLWRLGMEVPPPHFAGFLPTALLTGSFFALAWGGIMWLLFWRSIPMSGSVMLTTAVLGGVFFGLAMAAYYAHGRGKHGLPDWQSLHPGAGA